MLGQPRIKGGEEALVPKRLLLVEVGPVVAGDPNDLIEFLVTGVCDDPTYITAVDIDDSHFAHNVRFFQFSLLDDVRGGIPPSDRRLNLPIHRHKYEYDSDDIEMYVRAVKEVSEAGGYAMGAASGEIVVPVTATGSGSANRRRVLEQTGVDDYSKVGQISVGNRKLSS